MTGAPPPAIRPQANMDLTLDMIQDKVLPQQRGDTAQAQAKLPRTQSTVYRPHDDQGRPTNSVLHNTSKVPPKRPLPQDAADESQSRPGAQRNPSTHHDGHQAKRRRTSEIADGHGDTMPEPQPKMTAPPIRQSNIRQKVRDLSPVYTVEFLCANFYRTCHPSQSFLVGTPMRSSRAICREQLLSLSITSQSQPILWTWLRFQRLQFPLGQTRAKATLSTRRQRGLGSPFKGRRASRPPSRQRNHHQDIRTGIASSCQKSTPTRKTMIRTPGTTLWHCRGPTRPTSASSWRSRRRWIQPRCLGSRGPSTWKRCSARARTDSTSSGRGRRVRTGVGQTGLQRKMFGATWRRGTGCAGRAGGRMIQWFDYDYLFPKWT